MAGCRSGFGLCRVHRQHRARRRSYHCLGHASQDNTRNTATSVCAHDNEVDIGGLRVSKNLADGFVRLFHDRDRSTPEIGVRQTVLEPARVRLIDRAPVDEGRAFCMTTSR